jgi:small conductance mechanosensitive channel
MFLPQDYSKYIDIVTTHATQYLLNIISALLILLIGRWLARKLTNLANKLMLKSKLDYTLIKFSNSIIYFVLLLAVIMASLNSLGVQTTSFIAVFGAVGLAVGLALQGSLGNVGAAVLIMFFRPFKIGDTIEAGGATGTVEDINLFSTTISPIDNKMIIVPNSKIISSNITNFSKKSERRIEHIIGIGYDDDLKLAKSTLLEILHSDQRILGEPAPFVGVGELGDNSVNFTVRAWVKTGDYWDVYFALLEEIKLTFDDKGISIPYPQMDIHINNTGEKID